jgi:acyl-coenzyme A synthetase/AMP-(fatty) acid ligase
MAQERVTGFAVVPTVAAVLVGMNLNRYDLTSLRYITNAGASLPPAHLRRLRDALPHVDLIPMYGQTECFRISYLEPSEVDRRPDSVGRGMPNQELMLVDDRGRAVGPGETGELVVRGSHVMRGYWSRPSETAAALRPGRFPGELVLYTGDLFRQDADGYYYFVGRRDDVFKSRGEKVSPREVEDVLYTLPAVAEVVVFGVAHPTVGHVVKAVLVLRPGAHLTVRDVQRHCAVFLEEYMVPAVVEFRESLPKTDTGKISRALLANEPAEYAI